MRRMYGITGGVAVVAAIAAIALAFSSGATLRPQFVNAKFASDPDSAAASPGEGPAGGFDAYLAAERAYPAAAVPARFAAKAESTFEGIAAKDAKAGDPNGKGHKWKLVGPKENATQPGVTAFSGATNNTASRITALAVDPDCGTKGKNDCRVWVGAAGGGVWRTDKATGANPDWKQLKPERPRPELGRRAHARPDRQEAQHDLPRHRRGEPLLVRLRGRGRHLQVDRRRQQLEEARRRVRQQRDVHVRDPRPRRVPRPRHHVDRRSTRRTPTTSSSARPRPCAACRT